MRRECRESFPRHCGLAIPKCITARSVTRAVVHAGIANQRSPLKSMAGKTFPAFPTHAQPAILHIGKMPMGYIQTWWNSCHQYFLNDNFACATHNFTHLVRSPWPTHYIIYAMGQKNSSYTTVIARVRTQRCSYWRLRTQAAGHRHPQCGLNIRGWVGWGLDGGMGWVGGGVCVCGGVVLRKKLTGVCGSGFRSDSLG